MGVVYLLYVTRTLITFFKSSCPWVVSKWAAVMPRWVSFLMCTCKHVRVLCTINVIVYVPSFFVHMYTCFCVLCTMQNASERHENVVFLFSRRGGCKRLYVLGSILLVSKRVSTFPRWYACMRMFGCVHDIVIIIG